jgi:CheY-like chemotaxis protein
MLPPGDKELAPKGVHSSMGGITVLERILAGDFDSMGNGPDLPVVVVSAVALPEVKERVRNLLKEKAARRYLMKPIDFERIIEVLQSAITQRRECHGKY